MVSMNATSPPRWIDVPQITHVWGDLCFAETERHLPFPIHRVYWIHRIPSAAHRGGHSHHRGHEALFPLHGSCLLTLFSPDGRCSEWPVSDPSRGVLIPPGWWVELDRFADHTTLLVLAESPFTEDNYERDPLRFFHVRPLPHPVSRPRP
jgi:hypothetical protein